MTNQKKVLPLHRLTTKAFYNKGEMVEWSITAVLKTAVPRGTGGSNPSLSANKGVNQRVMRFAPFITPKNYRLRNDFKERVLNPKIFDLSCNPLSDVNMIGF